MASYTPSKNGYKFVEWRLGNDKYDFGTKVNGDITLTAKWDAIYIITLKPYKQTGTGAIRQYEVVSVTQGNNPFTAYKNFYFKGNKYVAKGKYVDKSFVDDGSVKEAEIILDDGSRVTATVNYQD